MTTMGKLGGAQARRIAGMVLALAGVAGCGGDTATSSAPVQDTPALATLSEESFPEGAREDLSLRQLFPLAAGDSWVYDRGTATLRRSVGSGPDADQRVTVEEREDGTPGVLAITAHRITPEGIMRLDPFDAERRYPGLFKAWPALLEYPLRAVPINAGARRLMQQGSLGSDVDGDGLVDSFRAEFTQEFLGFEQARIGLRYTWVAHFVQTYSLMLWGTRDAAPLSTVVRTEDTLFETDIGLVRRVRTLRDAAGTLLAPVETIELRSAIVGGRSLPAGVHWQWRDSGVTRGLRAVASSGSTAVAVGALGTILTSGDGRTWALRDSGTPAHLNGVTAGDGQFVAVGEQGTILRSADGTSWSQVPSGTSNILHAVTWSGQSFVAVGDAGQVLTSSDGAVWHLHDAGVVVAGGSTLDLTAVAARGGTIVAAGTSLRTRLSTNGGATWSQPLAAGTRADFKAAAWSGTQYVLVGDGGASSSTIQTSYAGNAWAASSGGNATLRAVAWSGRQFVAVGDFGESIASADGLTWTRTTRSYYGSADALRGVAWHQGEFIAVGAGGVILAAPEVADVEATLFAIAASDSLAVAAGANGTILSSTDGTQWTQRDAGVRVHLRAVSLGGPAVVAVGDRGQIVTSVDLEVWTATRMPPDSVGEVRDLRGVTWTGSQYVAVGLRGALYTSPDGVRWDKRDAATSGDMWGVAGQTSGVVALSNEPTKFGRGMIVGSADGLTWQTLALVNAELRSVIWTGSMFLAAGGNTEAWTSYDGATWTRHAGPTGPTGQPTRALAWSGERFLAVGDSASQPFTSTDATTWQAVLGNFPDFYGAAWFRDRFIAVGELGRIVPIVP